MEAEAGAHRHPAGATAQELADALNQGEFMVALTTVTADRGDASGLLSLWESGNGYFYSTAYDMLLRAADASGHVEVRDAYLEDAEAMLVEDGWVIPCTMSTVTAAWPSS
ncbi:MAG: hypothetical protein ACLR5H_11875 [Oscillospiraceae bacterium]